MHALRTDDVIAAISTPAGQAARGMVRLTGPGATVCAAAVFAPCGEQRLDAHPAWKIIPGHLDLGRAVAVPCNAVIFRPPHSYTGQELVELHLAGSPAVLEMALRACTAAGARLAGPGEFTARAFLAGRMDLVSAEAVAERIAAQSDAALAAAQQLAAGTLAARVRAATSELADLLSAVEAGIDFADEPIEFIDAGALRGRLAQLAEGLEDLLATSLDMQRLEVLPRAALVGPPNAGKSRLMNRLSGLDRSICSPIAGTTRDVLSAVMDTPSGQVLLLDGPGLGRPRSEIDRVAQEAWRDLLGRVDLVLLVLAADEGYHAGKVQGSGFRVQEQNAGDRGQGTADKETRRQGDKEQRQDAVRDPVDLGGVAAGRPRLVVFNKKDLLEPGQTAELRERLATRAASALTGGRYEPEADKITAEGGGATKTAGGGTGGTRKDAFLVSAATGEGCERLKEAIGAAVAGAETAGQGGVVLTARHRQALEAGLEAIHAAAGLIGEPAELVALHLREAAGHLGQVTGEVTTEDLLERVFSRFCIGK